MRARMKALLKLIFRRQRLEDELDSELRAYAVMLADRHIESGMTPEQAERAARLEMEGMAQVKEQVRDIRIGAALESIWKDLRFAVRSLRKNPGFSAIVTLTVALGIGISAAIFSVVDAVLLKPLPYERPEQLALVWSDFHQSAALRAPTSGPLLVEMQRRSRLMQEIGAIWVGNGTFTGGAEPEQVKLGQVTTNFFHLLGVQTALGRTFTPEERFGGRPAIVLSYGLWKRRFGGDPGIIGKAVPLGSRSVTIVGVLRDDFRLYLPPGANVPANVQAFRPLEGNLERRPLTLYFLRVVARMKPGVTQQQAQADMDSVAKEICAHDTEIAAEKLGLVVAPMQQDAVSDLRPALLALFTGAMLVLLICCVNVANLLLARASYRRKEIAIRAAIGASRGRILRQLLWEGFVLCTAAGALGLGLAWAAIRALLPIRPDYVERIGDVGLNWTVAGFAALVAFGFMLLFALAPALEAAKWTLISTLRESGRTSQAPARRGVRAALIVAEIALGFILVTASGLMIRTVAKIHQLRPGFEAHSLLTFEIEFGGRATPEFIDAWETRLAALPGVLSVGAVSHLPLDDYPNWYSAYRPEGVTDSATLIADHRCVTPGYLQSMGTRLLEGRYFNAHDHAKGQPVAIVDDMLARATWPGQSAVGKKIEAEHVTDHGFVPSWATVVGVVEHVNNHSLSQRLRGEVYLPFEQSPRSHLSFALRTRIDPLALAVPVRRELHTFAPALALSKMRPMTAYVERAQAPANFTAVLAAVFGALALALGTIGIYGVVYYSVSRRTQELGIRMALGATSTAIVRLVMSEGLALTGIGMALGLGGALLASRYLKTLIFGIPAIDPVTYLVALTVMPLAAILGCWRPGAKAAATSPLDAIRAD